MLDATSCELAFERNYDRDFMIDKRIDIYRCYVTYSLREKAARKSMNRLSCRETQWSNIV